MKELHTLEQFQKLPIKIRQNAYFPEEELQKISIQDCGEEVVNVGDFFIENGVYISVRLVWGKKLKAQLRQSAAERLLEAAHRLAPHYLLELTDALRPIAFQRKLFRQIKKEVTKRQPALLHDAKRLYYEVTKYIADPDGCPPHSTGGTVDACLRDSSGKMVDMGSQIDEVSLLSHTFSKGVPLKAQKNRKILFDAMTKSGFVNLPTEWWHYSYGDQYWAAFHKKPHAVYGKIEKAR